MFLAETLTSFVKALEQTFTADYPVEDFRGLHVSIEYPAEKVNYPGVWVGFEPVGDVSIAGIGHEEYATVVTDDVEHTGKITRWRFEGQAQFTITTLSSWSRARLVDEMIKVIGFGPLENRRGPFRHFLFHNPLVAMTMMHEHIAIQGLTETPGTPWGSDEVLYEVTLSCYVLGEFTSTPYGDLVPLTDVRVISFVEDLEEDTTTPGGWT